MLHGARCCNARGAVILLGYKYTHRSLGPTICVIQTYALRLTSADISSTFSLSTPKLHEATHKMRQQWFYDNENHSPISKLQFRYCKQHLLRLRKYQIYRNTPKWKIAGVNKTQVTSQIFGWTLAIFNYYIHTFIHVWKSRRFI